MKSLNRKIFKISKKIACIAFSLCMVLYFAAPNLAFAQSANKTASNGTAYVYANIHTGCEDDAGT